MPNGLTAPMPVMTTRRDSATAFLRLPKRFEPHRHFIPHTEHPRQRRRLKTEAIEREGRGALDADIVGFEPRAGFNLRAAGGAADNEFACQAVSHHLRRTR